MQRSIFNEFSRTGDFEVDNLILRMCLYLPARSHTLHCRWGLCIVGFSRIWLYLNSVSALHIRPCGDDDDDDAVAVDAFSGRDGSPNEYSDKCGYRCHYLCCSCSLGRWLPPAFAMDLHEGNDSAALSNFGSSNRTEQRHQQQQQRLQVV